jgi:hypothetical protein
MPEVLRGKSEILAQRCGVAELQYPGSAVQAQLDLVPLVGHPSTTIQAACSSIVLRTSPLAAARPASGYRAPATPQPRTTAP